MIAAATQTKATNEALIKVQEAAIAADVVKLEELRKLVADGLVARVELENAEALLAGLRTNLETFKNNIADSEQMIAELRKAEEMAKAKPLLASSALFLDSELFEAHDPALWRSGWLVAKWIDCRAEFLLEQLWKHVAGERSWAISDSQPPRLRPPQRGRRSAASG